MKIIVFGSMGNLGSQLLKNLEGHEVVGWDMEDVDITDRDLVMKKITDEKPKAVINTVAYNAVDNCETDEGYEAAKKLNAQAVANLAEACLSVRAVLVHIVSDYVFKGNRKTGYVENDKTDPINKYGESKVLGEKELIKRSGEGLKYYLVRTSKLFGPRGESPLAKESFFDIILKAAKNKKEIKAVHNAEISCFTYTPDLAKGIKELLEKKRPFGIYHIVNSGPASWYDGAKYLFELKGIKDVALIPVSSEDFPRPAKRPAYSVLLNTKLKPMRSWQEALKEYLTNNQ